MSAIGNLFGSTTEFFGTLMSDKMQFVKPKTTKIPKLSDKWLIKESDIFKDGIPTWDNVSLQQSLATTLGANEANLPAAEKYSASANRATRRLIGDAIPGFETMAANTEAYNKGEVPKDVQEAIMRRGAQKSTVGGFGISSGMTKNLQARDLGLTTLDLQQRGAQMTQSMMGMLNPFTARDWAFSPTQGLQNDQLFGSRGEGQDE